MPVWNPHLKQQKALLEGVQRRATKLLPGMYDLSYKERLETMNLPTLEYRRYRGDMIEMYKITHEHYDLEAVGNLLHLRTRDNPEDLQRRHHQFTVTREKCGKDVKKYFFKNRVAEQWNNLPPKVVTAPSLNSFKSRLDKLWRSTGIMFDTELDLADITSRRNIIYRNVDED